MSIDVAATMPDALRLVAECADERTELVFLGRRWVDVLASMTDETFVASGVAELLANEHRGRCWSCRRAAA